MRPLQRPVCTTAVRSRERPLLEVVLIFAIGDLEGCSEEIALSSGDAPGLEERCFQIGGRGARHLTAFVDCLIHIVQTSSLSTAPSPSDAQGNDRRRGPLRPAAVWGGRRCGEALQDDGAAIMWDDGSRSSPSTARRRAPRSEDSGRSVALPVRGDRSTSGRAIAMTTTRATYLPRWAVPRT